jgi:hypothetical protein
MDKTAVEILHGAGFVNIASRIKELQPDLTHFFFELDAQPHDINSEAGYLHRWLNDIRFYGECHEALQKFLDKPPQGTLPDSGIKDAGERAWKLKMRVRLVEMGEPPLWHLTRGFTGGRVESEIADGCIGNRTFENGVEV